MSALMLSGLASLALAAGAVLPAVRLAGAASLVPIADWVAAERWTDVPGPLRIREAADRGGVRRRLLRAPGPRARR